MEERRRGVLPLEALGGPVPISRAAGSRQRLCSRPSLCPPVPSRVEASRFQPVVHFRSLLLLCPPSLGCLTSLHNSRLAFGLAPGSCPSSGPQHKPL